MSDYLENIANLFDAYKLEVIWFIIVVFLFKRVKQFLSQKMDPGFERLNPNKPLKAQLKPGYNRILLSLVGLFAAFSAYMSIVDFDTEKFRESFAEFGSMLLLLVSIYLNGKNDLLISIKGPELRINSANFKAQDINVIELWDDLIYIKYKHKKEHKFWINFHAEHFEQVTDVMKKLIQYCEQNSVLIRNNFQFDPKTNESLNPKIKSLNHS